MASAPNMRIALSPATPGAPVPVEGEGGDVFSSLLSIVPPAETILDGPGATGGDVMPAIDAEIRPATPEAEAAAPQTGEGRDGEKDSGEDGNKDAATFAFTAAADFIPILQAQNTYPVVATVVAAPVPAAGSTPVGSTSVPSASPLAAPAEGDADAPDASGASPRLPASPAILASKDVGVSDSEAPDMPAPVKAALKAVIRAQAGQATDRSPAAPARAPIESRIETVKESVSPAMKAGPSAPVAQGPAIQAPAQPALVPTAVAAVIEPSVSSAAMTRASTPVPQPAEQAVERELDLARESEWLDRLSRDIARSGSGEVPLRFKLHPQTLGHLRVELTQGDQGMTVRLTAETEAARAIIADAQPRLMQEARAQGVRIAHAEVDLAGTGHQASGDSRRQEDERQPAIIRTARGADIDAAPMVVSDRASSDRYA